jgi:hypothetical protein
MEKQVEQEKLKDDMQTFRITGYLVSEEEGRSLKGLKAMAYVAGTKQLVGTAITDLKGGFAIEFKFPEPAEVSISVCPDVDEEAIRLLPKASYTISMDEWKEGRPFEVEPIRLPITEPIWRVWEEACAHYTVFGLVQLGTPDPDTPGGYLELIPIPDVTVHIYDVGFGEIPFPEYRRELGTATTDVDGSFVFEFDWCYILPPPPICIFPPPDLKPDLLFTVTQTVNGIAVPIYEEDPSSETRWDIDALPPLGVPIIVEGEVVLPDDPITPITVDFEFHGIGRVLISQIDSQGYADTSGTGDVVQARESPFGSTIDIKGQFRNALHGKYYQVLYAKWPDDATAPEDGDFSPILDEAWPIAQKIADNWVTVQKAPVSLPTVGDGCYEIPDYTDLYKTSKEILIRWRTHRQDHGVPRYPDGKYTLMVKAFKSDGTVEDLPAGGDMTLTVRVDNTWPVAIIKEDIEIRNSTVPPCPDPRPAGMICDNPQVCGIVYIENLAPPKTVRVEFDAYDEQNHFRRYSLTYRSGHDVTGTIASKQFTGPPREDYGFPDETADWEITGLSQCGYEVRLVVWDRTINGYHHIHWIEDFVHLILLEQPTT